ncbi:hypothetical protein C1645_824547 [Glomus cerebriforme]|uniref:Reverse transcriptase zinc-binding domain-containing protein n=1 Tax=Glomus cerebriforme TaxID=658196 RepID=A0A397SVF7_9GLOM|nr:hypothetical protein C1645_824547 [Glomus cerebriforme]
MEDFDINLQIDEFISKRKNKNNEKEHEKDILGEIKVETWGSKILTKRFNAFWKMKIIDYNIRNGMKNINQLKNKEDWMVQNRNKELRLNIDKDEIDWEKTYDFIMLRNKEAKLETSTKTSKVRSYRIKNLLEELPTLEIINRRNEEKNNNRCMRCKIESESWSHIWECDMNKHTLYDIVNEQISINIRNLKTKNIYVNEERWTDRIIKILLEKSMIKSNQLIIHDCIKGIFNKRITEIDRNKNIKEEMVKFIEGSTDTIEEEDKLIRLAKNNIAKNNKKIMSTVIANRYIDRLISHQEKVYSVGI